MPHDNGPAVRALNLLDTFLIGVPDERLASFRRLHKYVHNCDSESFPPGTVETVDGYTMAYMQDPERAERTLRRLRKRLESS